MSETDSTVMFEKWADIPGYEGRYKVSTFGRVVSLTRGKIIYMKERKNNCGYCMVDLIDKHGKRKSCYIHRLVAKTFLPNPPKNYTQVNHKTENKEINFVNQIEYCSPSYNMNYGTQFIRRAKPVAAYDIKTGTLIMIFDSQKSAAKSGFRQSSISLCINGRIKTHRGYIWRKIDNNEYLTNINQLNVVKVI